MKTLRPLLAFSACALAASAALAATTTYLVDFGAPGHKPYEFTAGDFGLKAAPVVVAEPTKGDYAGFGFANLVYQLGPALALTFPKAGGYNLGETETPRSALVGSFLFSSAGREEVGGVVTFTLTTKSRTDKITIAAIGSVQTGHRAVITLDGQRAVIDSSEEFIPVAKALTGKTTYEGSFATESGEGEANLGGWLVTIETR